MSSLARQIRRNKEREDIKNKYGKNPKHACPKCVKLTLFQRIKSKNGREKIICVQCKEVVSE